MGSDFKGVASLGEEKKAWDACFGMPTQGLNCQNGGVRGAIASHGHKRGMGRWAWRV